MQGGKENHGCPKKNALHTSCSKQGTMWYERLDLTNKFKPDNVFYWLAGITLGFAALGMSLMIAQKAMENDESADESKLKAAHTRESLVGMFPDDSMISTVGTVGHVFTTLAFLVFAYCSVLFFRRHCPAVRTGVPARTTLPTIGWADLASVDAGRVTPLTTVP